MSSNEPRDQLAALAKRIRSQAVISTRPGQLDELERIANDLAALELEFAGWRPPPRVIETASVLRDESHGTVIRFRDGTVAAVDTAGGHWPGRVMTLENPVDYWHLTDGDTELFPALVLWEPEEPSQ